jgi:hypothetical protein
MYRTWLGCIVVSFCIFRYNTTETKLINFYLQRHLKACCQNSSINFLLNISKNCLYLNAQLLHNPRLSLLYLTFKQASVYSYRPVFRPTILTNVVLLGDAFYPSTATFNSRKSKDFRDTFFHLKSVRFEFGNDLDVMTYFFGRVKACCLLMNINSVILLLFNSTRSCVGIAPLILTLDSVLSLVVIITQYLIESGVNSPLYTLNMSLVRHFQGNEFISPSINLISKERKILTFIL